MNETARHICRSIEAVSKALAEWTVSSQFEVDETLPQRYGDGARRKWVADTQTRIGHLAQALAVRSPELFIDSIVWMREAHEARGSNASDLALNLRCLRDVVAAELPLVVTDVALPCIEGAIAAIGQPRVTPPDASTETHNEWATLCAAYLDAIIAGRGEHAQSLVLEAAKAGASIPDLYAQVLHPAMREIGRRWQADEIGVSDEHYATAMTQMVMSQLRLHFHRKSRNGLRMLATAAAGDLHEIGVRMVADFFEMDGWDAIYLGANMPAADMLTTMIERDVHLVALSASSVMHMAALAEAIDAIRTTPGCERMKVIVGGPPFNFVPRLWKEVGADGFARSASEAVEAGNRLVSGHSVRA